MKKIISIILLLTLCLGLFAGCGETPTEPSTTVPAPTEPAVNNLPNAKALLFNKYKPASKDGVTTKAAAFEVINSVLVAGESYPVEWSVEVTTGAQDAVKVVPGSDGHVKVEVPEKPAEAVEFTLTATIKDTNGNSESVSFKYIVPKFRVNTFAEYVAAVGGDNVVTEGVISGIIAKSLGASNNCIYFQDADGGYYAYGMEKDPITDLNLAVGMTIRVSGVKDVFNGTHEIKDVVVEILSTEKADVVATDYTERYQNAADLKVEELVYQQAMLVTIKGVEITGQAADNGYYKFKLGELESYIRISGSTCPLTADEKAALIAAHSEHTGWIANVTGVICVYNGAFYLTPVSVDAFEYISLPEKSDAEKVEYEVGNLSFPTTVSKDTEIELPVAGVTYDQVAITWAVEGEGAAIVDGKLVLTNGEEEQIVTVTATLTSGEASKEVSFEIKLRAKPSATTTITLTDTIANGDKIVIYYPDGKLAFAPEDDGKRVAGVEAVLNGTTLTASGAAFIDVVVDENGYYTFLFEGKYLTAGATGNSMVWADAASDYSLWTLETAEGGYYIKSVNAAYNGGAQYLEYYAKYNAFTTYGFKEAEVNIYTFQFFKVTEEAPKADLAQQLADAALLANKTYLEEETTFTGTVVGTVKASSKNEGQFDFTLTDGTHTIRCYFVPVTGGTPVEGDTVTVTGFLTAYNGTPQFDENKATATLGGSTTEEPTDPTAPTEPTEPTEPAGQTPVAGVAYKFGMIQEKVSATDVYYLAGGMDGYYMATTANVAAAIDVYLEETEGGFYLYTMVGGTKTYINMVVSGTHVNGAYEVAASTVYTYDAESETLVATVDGNLYWFGTRNDNTYTTVGPCKTSYNGFYCKLYPSEA